MVSMVAVLVPKQLVGKRVRFLDGEVVGTIKGVSRVSSSGAYEEVVIQQGEGIVRVRAKDLIPSGNEFICRGMVYS
jgi:hypothetical protein